MLVCPESETVSTAIPASSDGISALDALQKQNLLRSLLRELGTVIVAYSGGVDSSYVAYIANQELGSKALCITGQSPSLPSYMNDEISGVVAKFGFQHEVVKTDELENAGYQANNSDRCYFCKDELYTQLERLAGERQISVIVDGSTTDDLGDHRPGRRAAAEHVVRSPLVEVGMNKAEVRELSRKAGLPTWDKPASPCLSSRIAYGTPVTIERLSLVDRGEEILRELGFREFRVRLHDQLVRLEISPDELERALDKGMVDELAQRFQQMGFKYVTLDLNGFRSGSMNEVLTGAAREVSASRRLKVI